MILSIIHLPDSVLDILYFKQFCQNYDQKKPTKKMVSFFSPEMPYYSSQLFNKIIFLFKVPVPLI